MQRIIVTLLLAGAFVISSQHAKAQDYRFGIGLRLSNSTPTLNNSISGKYNVTDKSAIEGLISFGSRFGLGALLELHQNFSTPGLRWFYGAGFFAGWQDKETYLGPTGILGIEYTFPKAPINISADWKPELDLIPDINFVPDAFAITVRFTLK
jgi:hypothetical protein